jgi:dTDP-4-amino-4,6-dideoxygalactose transaminase
MYEPEENRKLQLTRPFMPPLEELAPLLERIRDSRRLTNDGPLHAELEQALCEHLGIKYISLFANGTLALMTALRAMELKGEVITTPFTSVATVQAILWNNLVPVFADIREGDLNLDPASVERAITPGTSAILPVHVFGNTCDTERIGNIAKTNGLKVLYDATHCFGVRVSGVPLCSFGDLSVLSFHATKVFSTVEGGAVICHDEETKSRLDSLKNNGLIPGKGVAAMGLNAKMNEVQAAFGLVHLRHMERIIEGRKAATLRYRELLSEVSGLRMIREPAETRYNYPYLPVVIDPGAFGRSRDRLAERLLKENIVTRCYFSPLVTAYPEFLAYRNGALPVAEKMAERVLCLPLFHDITDAEVTRVAEAIKEAQLK